MTSLPTSRPFVVLIANDQEWSARSLDSILAPQGFTVVRAYTGYQALERSQSARPDLVILDAQLPDIHGLEVCRQLRADPAFGALTPIIITTAGPSGRSQRLAAYEAGAWEFYGQPLDGEALLARIATFLAAKSEADALRAATLLDTGSGLYTTRGLARRVQEIGSAAYRNRTPLTCIALSVRPGSAAGPGVSNLPRLGDLLRELARASDAIGHLGGEEYLVVSGSEESAALNLVGRLEQAMGERCRVVAGYSSVRDLHSADIEAAEVMDQATTALRHGLASTSTESPLRFEDLPNAASRPEG